ncbi:Rha family transcriptional regulator [Marinomonas sp.]|uniref:Rha family transcriptional regulator n=1 Tax=Marinomonas sp. TaxID=1904862 RepID=UPI003BA975B0
MSNLTPHVRLVDGTPVTSSRDIAEFFGRDHKNVIQKIQNLDCSEKFTQLNFKLSEYEDSTGRKLPCYQITRDGFTFLAMGFTGKRAAQFKEAYIQRFNELEQQAHTPALLPVDDAEKYLLLNSMIQSMGFTSAPVVVPSMEMIDLIRSVRLYQAQMARMPDPQGVDGTIERLKSLSKRNFLDEGV